MTSVVHFFPCAGLLEEPSFSAQERLQILCFQREVARRIDTHTHAHTHTHTQSAAVSDDTLTHTDTHTETDTHTYSAAVESLFSQLSMFSLAQALSLDLTALPKDSLFMVALWVSLLSQLSRTLPVDTLKYPTMHAFREAYAHRFDEESPLEQERLWQSANWLCVLFRFVSARKNKGLALQVVPKLVQGWETKYVTGSGQTRLTAHRVALFEREGDVLPCQRGRARKHAHTHAHTHTHAHLSTTASAAVAAAAASSSSSPFAHAKKRRRRSHATRSSHTHTHTHVRAETTRAREESEREWVYNYHYSEETHGECERERESFEDEFYVYEGEEEDVNELFSLEREREREKEKERERDAYACTDADEDSIENENDAIKSVFFSFISKPSLQRDESLQYPAHLELLRSQALLNCAGESDDGEAYTVREQEHALLLRSPMRAAPLARGVSWTEIPVNDNNNNNNNNNNCSVYSVPFPGIGSSSSSSASLLEFFGNTETVLGQQLDSSQLQTLFFG